MNNCSCKQYILNNKFVDCENFDINTVAEGKSVYDVIRIIKGVPLFFYEHVERLQNSAKLANLNLWLDKNTIKYKILKLIDVNKIRNGNVEIIFNFSEKNTFIAYFIKHKYPKHSYYRKGVSTLLHFAERENPNAKIKNNLLRYATNKLIRNNRVYEVILVDKNGYITEGSRSNIFFIKDDTVFTPPVQDVLPGITRKHIIDICKTLNFKVIEKKIPYKEINKFDSAFLTGTSPKALPISKIDTSYFLIKNFILNKIIKHYDYEIIKDIRKNSHITFRNTWFPKRMFSWKFLHSFYEDSQHS